MGRRRKNRKWAICKWLLLLVLLACFVHEVRFYLPRRIRPPKGAQAIEVEMKTTSYCHCRRCCSYKWFLFIPYQKTGFLQYRRKHVGKTSSGAMVRPGTIAADTSRYPYGTIMHIPGYGYGRVEDTGGAIKGNHIDLYRPNHWYARKWGVQTKKVKVWLPEEERVRSFTPTNSISDVLSNMLQEVTVSNHTESMAPEGDSNEVPNEAEPAVTNTSGPSASAEQIPLP